jgi:hypothetical protein
LSRLFDDGSGPHHQLTLTAETLRATAPVRASFALRLAVGALTVAVVTLTWVLGGGFRGLAYLPLFALSTLPGLPIGFALFGRDHAAGWVGGAALGYAISGFALWLPVQLHLPGVGPGFSSWTIVTLASFLTFRRVGPLVTVPRWTRRDTLALVLVLLAVPGLVWLPFTRIGSLDQEGNRRYRAYFTADFLWHVALTAELARMASPPRNPYLVSRPLNYYWSYFVVPAFISKTGLLPFTHTYLTINALCAGLVFVSMIFMFAWLTIPRAGPVAVGTLLALVAASAEGVHAMWTLWQGGRPFEELRHLNIDAITYWFLRGLTVDGLPRSLWYTPQHAAACALSLIALAVPAYAPAGRPVVGLVSGVALGCALIVSPAIGGAFSLIYGLTAICCALRSRSRWFASLVTTATAAVPTAMALAWCIFSGTFEGAGEAVAFGLSRSAMAAPLMTPMLALGPLLVIAIPALVLGWRVRIEAPIVAATVGFALFYFVTLTTEPIWIGWRSGQILLVTLPALAATTIAQALKHRVSTVVVRIAVVIATVIGLPTALIDLHNAQDVENAAMGPGFRWTVVMSPDSQAAVAWIRENTPSDAVVQMSVAPRGRETWTLIPTFAERRMAAGQPISLLRMREYDRQSQLADGIFKTHDPEEASRIARSLDVDFVYVDQVERQAFGDAAAEKFRDTRFFNEAFTSGSAAVYEVR